MAYAFEITCDRCGLGWRFENAIFTKKEAIRFARNHGFSVGKNGWICPRCKKRTTAARNEVKK